MNKDDLLLRAAWQASSAWLRAAPATPRRDSHPDHLVNWWDNLIDGVTRQDCESDLTQGDGAETKDRQHRIGKVSPGKFCAPYSSSALVINTFGPFRHRPAELRLDGRTGFAAVQFEYRCRNGLRTRHPPHFDMLASSPAGVIAVESKFLEPLSPKSVEFKPQYDVPFAGASGSPAVAEHPWQRVFSSLKSGDLVFKHLDAAQLVKHYLGLIVSFPDQSRTLLYLYWEPENAEQFDPFKAHRAEVRQFADLVDRCRTRFVHTSYRDLWRDWEQHSTWPGMPVHLERLRQRYTFSIA